MTAVCRRRPSRATRLITPGERVDVIVTPTGARNSSLVLRAMLQPRLRQRRVSFGGRTLTVEPSDQPAPKRALPTVARTVTPPPTAGATQVDIVLTLPPQDVNGQSEFRVNGVPYWKAKPYHAKLGETQLWTIKNDTKWDHPFHLHGYFFMPVDERAAHPPDAVEGHDQYPDGDHGALSRVVRRAAGEWMFHRHILDHAEGGLMGTVNVGGVKTTEHAHKKNGRVGRSAGRSTRPPPADLPTRQPANLPRS